MLRSGRDGAKNTSTRLCMPQMQGAWYVDVSELSNHSLLAYCFIAMRVFPAYSFFPHFCLGHFIQHCPTNGDPNYDMRKVKQPTGIPRSMLMVNPQGSYALPNGSVAVLKPNE